MFLKSHLKFKRIKKFNTHFQRIHKMSTSHPTKFKFAGIQMKVGSNKEENLTRAKNLAEKAVKNGAQVICLPEIFNCPFSNDSFPVYAESIPDGPTTSTLRDIAKTHKVYLIGGSFPEKQEDSSNKKLFNTCLIFNPEGSIIAKHQKVHLFDVNIPNQIVFQESKTLSAGNSITVFETPYCKIGVAIFRFPELSHLMRMEGAEVLVFPAAFNMTTGPAHWELLQRARAVDNQVWVCAVSPARNPESHSSVVSPWGEVVKTTEHEEDIIYAEIDLEKVAQVRQNIPTWSQKRSDIYQVKKVL